MRKFVLFLGLTCATLALGRPVLAITDPAVVQHKSAQNSASVNNMTITSTSNVTTGNYSNVTCAWFANGITTTVTDQAGNTYADTGSGAVQQTTGPGWIQNFKAKITAGGGATLTPKCNYSSATTFVDIIWHEIQGADATTPIDGFGSAVPNPAANAWLITAFATSTNSNVFVYTACAPQHNITNTPGPGYTATEFTTDAVMSEYAVLHIAGAHTPVLRTGISADNWACITVNYKSADQTSDTGVVLDNYFPVRADANNSATTWSGSFISGSGTNRLLVVRLYYNGSADTNSAPTYNSVSMTRVNRTCDDHATQVCQDVYSLIAPATGSNTLSVTFTSARFGYMIAKDFANVNQTTPITSIQTENVQTTNPSNVTVTAATGDWIDTGNVVNAKNACASSSTILDFWPATSGDPEMFEGHAQGTGSVTMGWTHITGSSCPGTSGNAVHAQIAFDIQAATAPARTFPHHSRIF
jgi:hypothetical protein